MQDQELVTVLLCFLLCFLLYEELSCSSPNIIATVPRPSHAFIVKQYSKISTS